MSTILPRVSRTLSLAVLPLFLIGSVCADDADVPAVTLQEAWDRLRSANPALAAARVETARRLEQQLAAKSLSGPQIEVTARYTRIDEPIVIDLNPIREVILGLHSAVPSSAIPSFVEEVQDDHFLKGQLTATLPVYTGGRIRAAQRAAAAGREEGEAELRRTEESLLRELVTRFYGAQLARAVRTTRASVLTAMDEHVRQAKRLEEEGFIARAESLNAQVARDEAWRECQRATRQVEIAEIALAGLLGQDGALTPSSPLFVVDHAIEPASVFTETCEEQHPALALMTARRKQAEQGVKAEAGRFHPEVVLFGTHELNRRDLTMLDPEWAAGVAVKLVLWEREDRVHRLAAARQQVSRVRLLSEDVRQRLLTGVEQAYREVLQAQEQFQSLASSLALAGENVRVREAAFREGQGTSLQVVDARLALARAETQRAAAARDFSVALATLLEMSGQTERFFDYESGAEERISP